MYDLLVVGSGPGGYAAAFRASDLGMKVCIVDKTGYLGGVCLNVGCIPSKTLLHVAKVMTDVVDLAEYGVTYGQPLLNLVQLNKKKDEIIGELRGGLLSLAQKRKVDIKYGVAEFESTDKLLLRNGNISETLEFRYAIIATGSRPASLPLAPKSKRILDSTSALELENIPKRLFIIGGGIIGLEMACVYSELGSQVTIIELSSNLIGEADRDLIRPLEGKLSKKLEAIYKSTKVVAIEETNEGLILTLKSDSAPEKLACDAVLIATGRLPNIEGLGLDNIGVEITNQSFVSVDSELRTNLSNIFAVGDVVGNPMLAHKSTYQGKVAAEVIAGMKSRYDIKAVPSVAYTDPEVAWIGTTEQTKLSEGIDLRISSFPWAASGRSLAIGRKDGKTKLIFDQRSKALIGAGVVGPNAGELIGELAVALEMGADYEDMALTMHAHPTLSETIALASEVAAKTCVDLFTGEN